MTSGTVKDIVSMTELDNLRQSGAPVVLHFWASWCDASKQMDQVFSHLATDFPRAHFFRVEAEEQPEISEAYSIAAVPYFVFFKDGKVVDTLEGADPSSLANKVGKVAGSSTSAEPAAPASLGLAAGPTIIETVKQNVKATVSDRAQPVSTADALKNRLEKLTNSHPVMLFMKGTPEEPRCGFSRKVVDILKEEKVEFGSFDILSDNEVREGLKKFSNWPTFPQLYCNGELLGGSDIAIAMHESGELKEALKDAGNSTVGSKESQDEAGKGGGASSGNAGISATLRARLEGLVNSKPVMLFMKGKPEEPKCGFSSKVVEILKQEKIEFGSFDILLDDEVRQGLKVYSNWSSYPQLYVKGELLGGSDIVLEMQKSGELRKVLSEKGITVKKESLEDRLKALINSAEVMLFMKGSPDEPKCGFSSKVVKALRGENVRFGSFDILTDEEVRQGIKSFSNWPTFPQLYYKGELIGGCDIIMELSENGDLKATLSE